MKKRRVLFVCEDNACVSQLAQNIVNTRLGGVWEAFSAGMDPSPAMRPETRTMLKEIGITCRGQIKHIDAYRDKEFDLFIQLYGKSQGNYQDWLIGVQHESVSLRTLGRLQANAPCSQATCRQVRQEIARRVPKILGAWIITQAA